MTDIQVRPTVTNDIERLIALDHSNSSEAVWQLELRRETGVVTAVFREARLPRATSIAFPHDPRALANTWTKQSMMQTALIDNAPVGYVCALEREPSAAWVTDLVVGAASRRQGIAAALLISAQRWALDNSNRRLTLEMQSKNLPMIRLAQKFGYEFCGYNDHYYSTQDVTLFFGKTLK